MTASTDSQPQLQTLLDRLATPPRDAATLTATVTTLVREHAMPTPPIASDTALTIVETIFSTLTSPNGPSPLPLLPDLIWLVEQMQLYKTHQRATTGTLSGRDMLLDGLLQSQSRYWVPLLPTATPAEQDAILTLLEALPVNTTDISDVIQPLNTSLRELPDGQQLARLVFYTYRLTFERRSVMMAWQAARHPQQAAVLALRATVASRFHAQTAPNLRGLLGALLLTLGDNPIRDTQLQMLLNSFAYADNLPPKLPQSLGGPRHTISRAELFRLALRLPPRQIQRFIEHPALSAADRKAIMEDVLASPGLKTTEYLGLRRHGTKLNPAYCGILRAIYDTQLFWEERAATDKDSPERNECLERFFMKKDPVARWWVKAELDKACRKK